MIQHHVFIKLFNSNLWNFFIVRTPENKSHLTTLLHDSQIETESTSMCLEETRLSLGYNYS